MPLPWVEIVPLSQVKYFFQTPVWGTYLFPSRRQAPALGTEGARASVGSICHNKPARHHIIDKDQYHTTAAAVTSD